LKASRFLFDIFYPLYCADANFMTGALEP